MDNKSLVKLSLIIVSSILASVFIVLAVYDLIPKHIYERIKIVFYILLLCFCVFIFFRFKGNEIFINYKKSKFSKSGEDLNNDNLNSSYTPKTLKDYYSSLEKK